MNPFTAAKASVSAGARSAIKVLVVDDSSVIRGIVCRWIESSPDLAVCGTAVNGQEALERVKVDKPDVIVLDIEMPVMDGVTALPLLLKACPQAKIIMASTLTRRNAEISLKALALGATDYVPKPTSLGGGEAAEEFRRELISRITAIGRKKSLQPVSLRANTGAPIVAPAKPVATPASKTPASFARPTTEIPSTVKSGVVGLRKASLLPPQILVIGASTGGPQALVQVMSAIAPQLNVPVLITQHMPATFTSILAESLSRSSGLKCVEGANGMMLERGCVYIAPGDFHMTIKGKGGPIELNQRAAENFCRPAVDPMFRSVSAAYGATTLAVVLTGMGYDGREGARVISGVGGTVLAQDEESSVVWGMPGAVVQAGLAAGVIPLNHVGLEIRKYLGLGAK